ncbi:LptF/LptG family permease [Ferruginibacter sp. SUN106]|uniref:LptF/LptG family permease n=1 Tax=Ferruginibacter sp. SUN106 TaxID=2978348 RepID=UPI003D36C1F8
MIKKLDKLIIKSFLGPFIATFFITLFILLMQTLWKYIDDLVGKGLDFWTIGKFIWYMSATLLMLAMPISILLSSIMTFGNLGESFELVAIKSSGISLLRFMRPLFFVALLLCGITFVFANYLIPVAYLKSTALYNDIMYKKPALDLKEGVFYTHIPTYAIKIGKKDDDGKTIHNVLIYEQSNPMQDNCIVAETGIMKTSDDKQYLEFNLQNGYRYQERGNSGDTATEYIRLGFKTFKKLFDLTALRMGATPDSIYKSNYKMKSVRLLNLGIDSLKKIDDSLYKRINAEINGFVHYFTIKDSTWKKNTVTAKAETIDNLLPDSARLNVYETATNTATFMRNTIQNNITEITNKDNEIKFHKLEWHRKYSLSLACLVLFFIGAPLGSIIRKGGLGMPLVVAIVFFLIFHLLNMFGEKFVKEDIASPLLGMWLSVLVLIPVGIFLTYKALHDSQLFSKEFYNRVFKRFRLFLSTFSKAKDTLQISK